MLTRLVSWQARIQQILRATKTHALNLAKYVALYKTLLLVQKKSHSGKVQSADPFIAGTIAGFAIFGSDRSAVNEQVRHCTQRVHASLRTGVC